MRLKSYMDNMIKIDNKIKELRQYRAKEYDKYSLFRFYRLKYYNKDILILGLSPANKIVDESENWYGNELEDDDLERI